jgi:hypothetical protein
MSITRVETCNPSYLELLGDERFVQTLERIMGRVLIRRPPGRKKKVEEK